MKTPQEILEYIDSQIHFMLTRPKMFAADELGLEIQVLSYIQLYNFIVGRKSATNFSLLWELFAKDQIGFEGVFPVATFLRAKKGNDCEVFEELTELLGNFYAQFMV